MTCRVVLVGLSLADVPSADRLVEVADETGADIAFLQGGSPSLTGTLDRLLRTTPPDTVIRLVPVSLTGTGTPRSWVGRVAGHWVHTRGARRVEVARSTVRELSAAAAREAARPAGRPVTGHEAPLESPEWDSPPPFDHHVLVCRGPRCNAKGAEDVVAALAAGLREHRLLDAAVLTTQTGCLFPCNHAPVIVRYPAGSWYYRVDPSVVEQVIAECLES